MYWLETFVRELKEETWFTNTCVSDNNIFKQIWVRHGGNEICKKDVKKDLIQLRMNFRSMEANE